MVATMHYVKPDNKTKKPVMREAIAKAMEEYFNSLSGETPEFVYSLVLTEVELSLLQATMKYVRGNQSLAAKMLGVNRGTFRKKLTFYGML